MKLLHLSTIATLSLAPAVLAQGNGSLDRVFSKADINENNFIDATEFLAFQNRGKPWTEAMHRFNFADIEDDDQLSLVEFRASKGGKEGGKPSKSQTYLLADLNDDGLLDPEEFARTIDQSKPWRKILRDFDRKDRSDDGFLSPQEFGISLIPL